MAGCEVCWLARPVEGGRGALGLVVDAVAEATAGTKGAAIGTEGTDSSDALVVAVEDMTEVVILGPLGSGGGTAGAWVEIGGVGLEDTSEGATVAEVMVGTAGGNGGRGGRGGGDAGTEEGKGGGVVLESNKLELSPLRNMGFFPT